jgi:hypothetical protein
VLTRTSPYYDFTAAAALQIALHGFLKVPYLAAGTISVALLAASLLWRVMRARNAAHTAPGGQP